MISCKYLNNLLIWTMPHSYTTPSGSKARPLQERVEMTSSALWLPLRATPLGEAD